MGCDITSGILKGCNDAKAGVETIYLGKWSKDLKYTFDGNTLLTLTADYYEYECIDASYTSVIERDDGGEFYQIDVKAEFTKVTKEKSSLLNDLSNMILFAILKTKNEELIYLGLENGLNPKINETTGGAKTDFNGYSLDLSGVQTEIPPLSRNYPNNPNNPFFVDLNGVTVKLKNGFSVGIQGQADGDLTNKTYTAVDDTTIRDLDPATDDYTSICTTLCTDLSLLFFNEISFNQNINSWDTSSVTDLSRMFDECTNFNQPLNSWDTSNVTDMYQMFRNTPFNQNINSWDVSNVTDLGRMFDGCSNFNQPLNNWNTSSNTKLNRIFFGCTNFNQPLNNWDVSNVDDIRQAFDGCANFNQNINNWDVSNVTLSNGVFYRCTNFNQPLNDWDTSNFTSLVRMFSECTNFNQPLNNWNTSNVTSMFRAFDNAENFNQPLSNWNTSLVTDMEGMFTNATVFNQDLSGWCVELIPSEPTQFALNSALTAPNMPLWGDPC